MSKPEGWRKYEQESKKWPCWLECLCNIKFLTDNRLVVPSSSEGDKEKMLAGVSEWKDKLHITPENIKSFEQITDEYVRADKAAILYQNYYRLANFAVYLLAVFATGIVSFQTVYFKESHWIVGFEVLALVATMFFIKKGNQQNWHRKWIDYRYLAERFRSGFRMAVAGRKHPGTECKDSVFEPDPWMNQCFDDAMCKIENLPKISKEMDIIKSQCEFIREKWVKHQLNYHKDNIGKKEAEDHKLHSWGYGIFIFTIIAAILHTSHLCEKLNSILTLIALVFPVLGAAFNAMRLQFDYQRIIQHSKGVEKRLTELSWELTEFVQDYPCKDDDLNKELSEFIYKMEDIMMSENQQWHGIIKPKSLQGLG